jgi:uncharacterized Zn finger protein/superfamily II DNA or RNA helicase
MATQFGKTWWGQEWLKSLAHIDYSNRLPRGRTYANNGSVLKLTTTGNKIYGSVQGSRRFPYRITLEVTEFSKQQKERFLDELIGDPYLVSMLLKHDLPTSIIEVVTRHNLPLFPKTWRDLKMDCTCPDSAVPCKHIAAIIYTISVEIDRNPFMLFELHGLDIPAALESRQIAVPASAIDSIRLISDMYRDEVPVIPQSPLEKSDEPIDFTRMDDLMESLKALLNPTPLFSKTDFKSVVSKAWKELGTCVKLSVQEHEEEVDTGFADPYLMVKSVQIVADDNVAIRFKLNRSYPGQTALKEVEFMDIIPVISRISTRHLDVICPDLRFLTDVYQFCISLAIHHGCVPNIYQTVNEQFIIRWEPALLNQPVSDIFNGLLARMRPDLVYFEIPGKKGKKPLIRYVSGEDSLTLICSWFLSRFMVAHVHQPGWIIQNHVDEKLARLFFGGMPVTFTGMSEKEIPGSIHIWLSKFHIISGSFIPVIMVQEARDGFDVEVAIEQKSDEMMLPVSLNDFLTNAGYQKEHYEVLKNLTLLAEHLPGLKIVIQSSGKKNLHISGNDFAEILIGILPVIQLFGVKVVLPKSLKELVRPAVSMHIRMKGTGTVQKSFLTMGALLDFDWKIALGNQLITTAEFRKLAAGAGGLVRFKDQYILINPDEIKAILKRLDKNESLKPLRLMQVALTEEYEGAGISLTDEVRVAIRKMTRERKVDLPAGLNALLRPYQQSGYQWLYRNSQIALGSLIADDMGLGKTIQVITLLLKLRDEGGLDKKPALAIVPTSLLTNWEKEVAKFAPGLTTRVYHGQKRNWDIDCHLLITSYGILRSDITQFEEQTWSVLIIDEAQNIKNPETDQTRAVKKISAGMKIAMTGTPVENRLTDYWSIMDFLNHGYLGSEKSFKKEYAIPIQIYHDQHQVNYFRKITAPLILRRLKTDKSIIQDLPDKIENDQYCSLTKNQAALYEEVVKNSIEEIDSFTGIERSGKVFKLLIALKQICNHPFQFIKTGSKTPDLSGKMILLFNLLDNILEANEKTLIFTQYKEMGDLLVELINQRYHTEPLFLHGTLSRPKRDALVTEFQESAHNKIFILSLKAGGTGLNLTGASNVIHYDLWWNPAVENQATDRAYRIGQTKNVMVYRMLTTGTLEEKINRMIISKKELVNLTVNTGEKWLGDLSSKELKELVRLG